MKRRKEIETAARVEYPREIRWTDMGDEDWNLPGYNDFIVGAQWADKTMIDKAVEWIKDHLTLYISMECKGWEKEELIIEKEKLINDFRKAMEE